MGKVLNILRQRTPRPQDSEATLTEAHCQAEEREIAALPDSEYRARRDAGDVSVCMHSETTAAPMEDSDIPFIEIPESPAGERKAPAPLAAAPVKTAEAPSAKIAFEVLPPKTPTAARMSEELVVWYEPNGVNAQYYREASAALTAQMKTLAARTAYLVPIGNDAKTYSASANLALSLAGSNCQSVLLIDCDAIRKPLTALFGMVSSPGWIDVLGGVPLQNAIRKSGCPGICVIPAGDATVKSASAAQIELARTQLGRLTKDYDYVLACAPCWPGVTTPPTLAEWFGVACLVQSQSVANPSLSTDCLAQLQKKGVRVIGSLMVSH